MFSQNGIREIGVLYMEVPCCVGLVHTVKQALADSGKAIPLKLTKIGVQGEIRDEQEMAG